MSRKRYSVHERVEDCFEAGDEAELDEMADCGAAKSQVAA
jgi:hypothetical protein